MKTLIDAISNDAAIIEQSLCRHHCCIAADRMEDAAKWFMSARMAAFRIQDACRKAHTTLAAGTKDTPHAG